MARPEDKVHNLSRVDWTRRIADLEIPLPSPDEQRQIAAVLSAVQRAIERQVRLVALTAELEKALMHKLFIEGTRGEPARPLPFRPRSSPDHS